MTGPVTTLTITNPATGEVIDELPCATADSLAAAMDAARSAQATWAAVPLADRIAVVERFAQLVAAQTDDLAGVLTAETGKPIGQSAGELGAVIGRIDFFTDRVTDALAITQVGDDGATVEMIAREPLGVVANISAWNYPWFVGTNVFIPALLAGNAVLYKPSEYATLTGLAMGRLMTEAGLPDGVFTVVVGGGDAGALLLELEVDAVAFTGSYPTGRRIAETMAARLIPVQLELGGKDPVYVTDDVDVAAAAETLAEGAFYNNGQSCCAVERLYVHADVFDEFVDRFVTEVRGFALGDPTDPGTFLGPLARPQHAAVLAAQVDQAVAEGAVVRTGGHVVERDGGVWFAPTVLTGVTDDMAVMRDESFGPVIGIARVGSDDEAVARMNDTSYGLTAGVFCADEDRAVPLLGRLDAGSAYFNCCDRVSPRLPWSGRRNSGMGLTLSVEGIVAFTQPKAYHLRRPQAL
jgi:acyl-CoA reductase-like NAD-dependent aldehyde dehydrogenase